MGQYQIVVKQSDKGEQKVRNNAGHRKNKKLQNLTDRSDYVPHSPSPTINQAKNHKSYTVVENKREPETRSAVHHQKEGKHPILLETVDDAPECRSPSDVYTHNGACKMTDARYITPGNTHTIQRLKISRPDSDRVGNETTTDNPGDSEHIGQKSEVEINNNVFNFSDKNLTQAQLSVLSKGLKFIPTTDVDITKLIVDVKEWERRMRLREYFSEKEEEEEEREEEGATVRPRKERDTRWTPPSGRDKWLDAYLSAVREDIIKNVRQRVKKNMTREEELAVKQLIEDETIVIRPADKGSGITVLNTSDYRDKILEELADKTTYREIPRDVTETISNKIKKSVNEMYHRGAITKELKTYMTPKLPTPGLIKGNPKVHKPGNPLRIIISGTNHPTEHMAEIAEEELDGHVKSKPSYIKDTTDFLQHLRNIQQPLPEDVILFCMDVKKLYPSVPRKEGIEACREALDQRPQPRVPTDEVVQMIENVLDNNNFQFEGRNYIQTDGTAIGSRLGKNYACTYMGKWEQQLLDTPECPLAYFRFVDDIWGLWTHGVEKLKAFHHKANSIHQRIQVDLRYSRSDIEFLDTKTFIEYGEIKTDLYCKPTDTHQYLHNTSDHPKTTKRAIPYGVGVRIKRICSESGDYNRNKEQLETRLKKRGYRPQEVTRQLQKVDNLDRDDLLTYREKDNKHNDRVPLVVTYSKKLPNIGGILHKRLPILHRSEKMRKVFVEPPMTSYRRGKNLADICVHAKHRRQFNTESEGCFKCAKKCEVCKYIIEDTSFAGLDNTTYKICRHLNCETRNAIYCINCTKCDIPIYVGETGDKVYTRMQNHMSRIRTGNTEDPIGDHFNSTGHSLSHFRFQVIEKVRENSYMYRTTRELFWIKKLKTSVAPGINKKE